MSFFFALGHKCYHTCENTPLVLTTHIAKTFVSSGFYHACLVTVNRIDLDIQIKHLTFERFYRRVESNYLFRKDLAMRKPTSRLKSHKM